ncbi:MAG: S8 family serine peptidase [Anaerolineae bacterium]|nr:S8 family serine peptidase [Anaerolineae bacterium]
MDRKPAILLIVVLVLGVLLIAAAGIVYVVSRQSQKPPEVKLPPSLDEVAEQYPELAKILENSKLDSVYKEFLMVYEDEGEDAALEMARERGVLVTNEGKEYVRLTLVLDTEDNAPLQGELEDIGIVVVSAYRDQIEVAIPLDLVRQELASDDPGAIFDRLTEMNHVIAVRLSERKVPDGSVIEGEGVGVIDAKAWQDAGFTGAGLRIGVLDLGFAGYEDLLSEELPNEVAFEKFGWRFSEDAPMEQQVHGTACAEIIHEIAPDAELVLAMYDGSQAAFGEAVEWLVGQDVDIVSHSAGGVVDPRDGTGWMSKLVDETSAKGILWVNAAGNEALAHHRGTFTDANGDGVHEFPSGDQALAALGGGQIQVVLIWKDEWERSTQDYQLYVLDSAGELLGRSEWLQSGGDGEWPVEVVQVYSGGSPVFVVIAVENADRAVTFDIFIRGGIVDYPSASYSVSAPADAFTSLTVGAANWSDDSLAEYSSQGPTADDRLKPEISAPTGVSGASYGDLGMTFTGTSASCPHVAGAAALVWDAYPDYTPQEVGTFLLTSAVDLGPAGPDTAYGYGRLELPESPEVVVSPEPTEEPGPTAAPDSTATPVPTEGPTAEPLPTTTPVTDYVVPTQVPVPPPSSSSGGAGGLALVAGVGIVVLLLGCGGVGLLFVGLIGLVFLTRRGRRRARLAPPPPPGPYAPPPPAPVFPPPQPGAAEQPHEAASCPHCGAVVRPGARFCAACGNSIITRPCPNCGAPVREGVRFCGRCGRPL